jgi:hypothetical protein
MNENLLFKDRSNTPQPVLTQLRAAQKLVTNDRKHGLGTLNRLFRGGMPPNPPLDGRYHGELIALDIAPGLTQSFDWITGIWMPWLGKAFNASRQAGDNIFAQDSYLIARLFNPFYRGFVADEQKTYQGFTFHTYIAPGLIDDDRMVLKIDYDLDGNPSLTVRRILDELVQVDRKLYLGKAHIHWWWGRWQTVAYFALTDGGTISGDIS